VSRAALLFAVVTLGAMRDPCGTETTLDRVNGPCQRSSDCLKDLSCVGGVCVPPDSGPGDDGGPAHDAQTSDVTDGRAGD
jgi:hypothetical protein